MLEKKRSGVIPGLKEKTLDELEALVSDNVVKNNLLALEMIKRPNFNRELVNELYNGLGVMVKMGKEGTHGKGIILKRKKNLQQFYTSSSISNLINKLLNIPEFARVFDPTCGTGRLFFHMPNPEMCHGIEIEHDAYKIARVLYPKAQLIQDSTIHYIFEEEFDYVVANPPFSLYWEDELGIFKFHGYKNNMVSEMAVMESAIRSLRQNGYLSIIMPSNVWLEKFYDKVDLVTWMKDEVDCIAKIELPSTTHKGTVYPTTLYIFKKSTGSWKEGWDTGKDSRLPRWLFTDKLASFEEAEIDRLINDIKRTNLWQYMNTFSESIPNQVPYRLKIKKIKEFSQADYLTSAVTVESADVVELDTQLKEFDSFILPPINLMPNGLHADLKINAIRSLFPFKWSPSRKEYVDLFKSQLANLDGFLDERKKYDDLQLIKNLHTYDCTVTHSPGFVDALAKRRAWVKFQDVPLEIWIDEKGDFNWKKEYADKGYSHAYPEVWNKWTKKLEVLENDSKYVTFLPFLNKKANWIKHLFDYQKNDVLRLTQKASAIHAGSMGLGKTRSAIATALLKGFDNNLLVCQKKLVTTWMEEFEGLGMTKPYLVEYVEDLDDMMNHQFVITTYESLRAKKDKKRPKGKKRNPAPSKDLSYNYDLKSEMQVEGEIRDLLRGFDFGEREIEDITITVPGTYKANPARKKGEESEAAKKIQELQTMPLFADHFTNKFGYMIVDEAHNLQNPLTKQTQAVWRISPKHLLLMSGTPIKNRVKGLLSLLLIGWGEDTTAMPYTKAEFLEHFMQEIEVEYEIADSHGYLSKKTKTVEIPQIANPDDLRTLMAGKWLRRTKYEPDVANNIKFPYPEVNFINIKPSEAESRYGRQWYDELNRLKGEVQDAKEELKALRDKRNSGWGWTTEMDADLEEKEAELRTKAGIIIVMIGKLRAVALAPQLDWLGKHTATAEGDIENLTAMQKVIHIAEPYPGGRTPRQEQIINELTERVKRGEQCYTICDFPAFNRQLLKPWLDKKNIKVEIIDGAVTQKRRAEIINKFRDKKIDVLLATIGTFDVGINIPAANYCMIMMPTWNFSDVEQAYNRMIRPQSKGERTVDIFILENTIEDYVKQLMLMKRVNQEYVIDYGPRPPEQKWFGWIDAVNSMFVDIAKGDFNV